MGRVGGHILGLYVGLSHFPPAPQTARLQSLCVSGNNRQRS